MKTLKFIPGPGSFYDLCFLFVLYFNQDTVLPEQVNRYKTAKNEESRRKSLVFSGISF